MSDVAPAVSVAPVAAPASAAPAAPAPAQTSVPVAQPKADATKADAKAPVRGPDGKFQTVAPKADAPAEAQAKRLMKLIVDGQADELDLDNPEHLAKLQRDAQIGRAKEKRFEESKKAKEEALAQRAQVNQILESLLGDKPDIDLFTQKVRALGKDPVKLAQAILMPEIQKQIDAEAEAAMTPEQKDAKTLKAKLAAYEAKEAQAKADAEKTDAAKKAEARQVEVDKHAKTFADAVQAALKETKLPATDETALTIVELLQDALQNGTPTDAKTLARDLETRELAKIHALLGAADDAQFDQLLPKPLQERINKAKVEQFKKDNPMLATKPVSKQQAKDPEPKKQQPSGSSFSARFARLGMQLQNGSKKP